MPVMKVYAFIHITQNTDAVPPTGEWQQGQFALGPQCEGGPHPVHYSHPSLASLRDLFCCIVGFKSGCFFVLHLRCWCKLKKCTLYLTWLLCSRWLGPPYVVLFDLKPLNEDGNLQVCMYCMHARKGASEASRTHFRACKFLGACPQTPLTQCIVWTPHFVFALGLHNPLGSAQMYIFWMQDCSSYWWKREKQTW